MSLEKSKSIEAGLQSIVVDSQPQDSNYERLQINKASNVNPIPSPQIVNGSSPGAVKNMSMYNKIHLIMTNITVEPIMICYVLPSVMASLATQNLSLEKACRVNLNFEMDICDALTARNESAFKKEHEAEVQVLVATMNAWKNVIQSVLPSMLLLFLGSWSDRHQRRKPCIVIPIIGEMLSCAGFLLASYFFYQLPVEFNTFFEAVPPALTGGWFTMFMGVYSYVSGLSSVETRTLRIGAVSLFSNVSVTIGIALSGILYKEIGFYGVFSLSIAMYTIGLLHAILFVSESSTPLLLKDGTYTIEDSVKDKHNLIRSLKDFFDFKHIKETFRVVFKSDGSRHRKKRICTIMILVMVIIGPMHGEMNVMYLFVRYKFGWDEVDYSLYSTFHFVFHILGTIFSLLFFSKFLKVDDAVLGMISSCSKICACLVYAFAPTSTIFYIGALVEVLNGTSFIAMRSIMSKLVPVEELGKINSLFGVSEALMPLIYGPMYSIVYKLTINTLPGAFFLLGGVLTCPGVIIFFWLYTEHVNDKKKSNSKETDATTHNPLIRE